MVHTNFTGGDVVSKANKTLSLPQLDESLVGVIASYCHLLKSRLQDNWSVNRINNQSDVIFLRENEEANTDIDDRTKAKVILSKNPSDLIERIGGEILTYRISYPINSSKILGVLNAISESKVLKDSKGVNFKMGFSLKNAFSKFMHSIKEIKSSASQTIKKTPARSQNVATKIMELGNPDALKTLKVVFLGRPGSGKTTAISSACDNNILTSEVKATDTVGLLKQNTTIGIDFGEYNTPKAKLRVYGTPGQKRYDFVQNQTVDKANIYVILVDLSSVAPYAEFLHYREIIDQSGNRDAMKVVAFTHYDIKEHNMAQLSKEIRHKCNDEILTVKVDTRQKDEVRFMLNKVTEMVLDETPAHQYYAENSLFLKNING